MTQSIEALLTELGIVYKILGEEASASCPFHSPDRHPSWSVNIRSGLHNCFSCGAKGNLAHLVSFIKNITYAEAVIYANKTIGWARADKWRENYETKNYAPPDFKISEADLAMFVSAPEHAIQDKRITAESASKFGVRWNPGKESWIFPIREPYSHRLWGWQEKNARVFRNYPSGTRKSKTLFGLDAFEHGSTAILVESPIDAVRLDAVGIRGGLSSWGVQVSDFQLSLIHNVTEHLIIAFDNDVEGVSKTSKITREFKLCSHVSIFNYGNSVGKDPGELTDDQITWGIANAFPALKYKEK